jgi:acyl-CoA reductase-like NAD-dependent aldehyde dehydrogenase
MSDIIKNIFVVIICIVCAWMLYYFLIGSNDTDSVGKAAVEQELIDKTQSFITRSAKLKEITIDQSLFTNSTFTSLRSFSTPVPDQPLGRTDIFGPVGSIKNVSETESDE